MPMPRSGTASATSPRIVHSHGAMQLFVLSIVFGLAAAIGPGSARTFYDIDIRGLTVSSELYAPPQFGYASNEAAIAANSLSEAMGGTHIGLVRTGEWLPLA